MSCYYTSAITTRATLKDLPADFSLSFLKGPSISLKSRQQGFKYCAEEYYHDVKMFIDEDLTISCSARCYASYRTNDEPRTIHLDIKPTEISLAHCSCQAGSGETCSHLVGFITALSNWQLMGLTEVPAELPCTSLPQRWSIPRGTKIEPEAVPHMIFINPKPERKKRPIKNTLTDNRKVKVQEQDLEHLKGLENCPISYLVCNPEKTIDTHLGPVPVASGLSTHVPFKCILLISVLMLLMIGRTNAVAGALGDACDAGTCTTATNICDPSDFKCKVLADGTETGCSTDANCPANSACSADDDVCNCNSGYTHHGGLCTVIGDTCTADSDCSNKITNSYCAILSPCSKGVCECSAGYTGSTCATLTYDKTCVSSADLCGRGLECSDSSKCACTADSWVSSVSACTGLEVFGGACDDHNDCYLKNDAHGECISKKCSCEAGYYEDTSVSGTQSCRLPFADETCSTSCAAIFYPYLSGSDTSQAVPTCTSKCSCGSGETMYEAAFGSGTSYKYCLTDLASGTAKKANGATCTHHNECSGNVCMQCPGDAGALCYTASCNGSGIPLFNGVLVFLSILVSSFKAFL